MDEQRGIGPLLAIAADAAPPDLDAVRRRQRQEAVRLAALAIDARRGVGLAPAVVVLTGGEQEVVAARMVGESVAPPQREQLAREVRVIVLRHQQQRRAVVNDDHPRCYAALRQICAEDGA